MSDRNVKVTLSAQVAGYVAGMKEAAQATRETGSATEKLAQQQQAFEQMGRASMVAGGAVAAGLALSAKAAIDWDSAWAGVTKTVDGSPEQLAAVESGLRGLTSVLPASHTEIAAVAEAAGQLGIQTENVVAFTRTMIDLGETTNLSASDAATQLARFMTVMGTAQGEVSGLGSALVELGNNYATTEAEIMAMAMRLSGAGAQIGMSEGQVLGLSTALSSVGIEAEAGGSAMSKVMIDIASSVDKGGERVEQFAQVAGMSADAFSQKWKAAPGEALAAFVKGLANAEAQGKSTFGILEELGITEVRMRDALLRSASAADQFNAAMETGNEAFEQNNALTEEAEKRYGTTESKLNIMKNRVVDAAISLGEHLLPAVEGVADGVGSFADMLSGLDGPMGAVVAWGGLITAGVLLMGGAALNAVPKIAALKVAAHELNLTGSAVRGKLGGLGAFLGGPWGIALGLATVSVAGFNRAMDGSKASAQEFEIAIKQGESALSTMLDKANQNESGAMSLLVDVSQHFENLPALADKAATAGRGFWSSMSFNENAALDSVRELGNGLNMLAVSDLPLAQKAFKEFVTESGLDDTQALTLLNEEMVGYKGTLLDAAQAAGLATDDMSILKYGMGELSAETKDGANSSAEGADALDGLQESAAATQEAISALADEIAGFGSATFDMRDANRALEESYDTLAEKLAASGLNFDVTTEAGRQNEQALDSVAQATNRAAAAIWENGGSQDEMNAKLAEGRNALIDILAPYFESRDAAAAYVDELNLISPEKVTDIIAETDDAHAKIAAINADNPPEKILQISANAVDAYAGIEGVNVMKIDEKTAYVWGDNADAVKKIDDVNATRPLDKKVWIGADDSGFRSVWQSIANLGPIQKMVNFVTGKKPDVNANGGMYAYANGGIEAYANGGFPSGIYKGGTPIHKFAEPETLWEAYISGKPSERDRNRQIWIESGERLGMNIGGGGVTQNYAVTVQAQPGQSLGEQLAKVNHELRALGRGGRYRGQH